MSKKVSSKYSSWPFQRNYFSLSIDCVFSIWQSLSSSDLLSITEIKVLVALFTLSKKAGNCILDRMIPSCEALYKGKDTALSGKDKSSSAPSSGSSCFGGRWNFRKWLILLILILLFGTSPT